MTKLELELKIWNNNLEFWKNKKVDFYSVTTKIKEAMIKFCEEKIKEIENEKIN
jgi:hypothetical protein